MSEPHILQWSLDDRREGHALHELADKYGVSAERMRQIEANAINKLKGLMAAA